MTREMFERRLFRVLRVLGIIFFLIIVGFPFYWMILSSVRPLIEMFINPTDLLIRRIDLSGYRQVLVEFGFFGYFKNSLYVSGITVVVTTFLGTLGAYAVARLRFRGRELISKSVLLIYMFPAIVLVIPMFVIFARIGMRDSLNSLIIVYVAMTLPVALYMLRSYFQTLPPDLEEAGLIDGCSRLGVIWRITLPLSLPAMATVALFTFMIAWNEFLFALIFLDSPSKFTLPRGIWQFAGSINVSQQMLMAGAVIITVPVIVLFLVFERYLVKGLTAGAVKG